MSKFKLIFLIILAISVSPTVIGVINLKTEPSYLNSDEFDYLGLKENTGNIEKYDYSPTPYKRFNKNWVTKEFIPTDNAKGIFSKLDKMTVHTADTTFRIKGKASHNESSDSFDKNYKEMSYTYFKNNRMNAVNDTNNVYVYNDNNMAVFSIAADDYFIFEFNLKDNHILNSNDRIELSRLLPKIQNKRTCELSKKWYMKYSFGVTVSSTLKQPRYACKRF